MGEEYQFKMQRYAQIISLGKHGVRIGAERFKFDDKIDQAGQHLVRLILDVATQEEPLVKVPANWFESLKEALVRRWNWGLAGIWFGRFVRRWWPVRYIEYIAMHKFPEVAVPEDVLGREFVHLKVVDVEELEDVAKEKEIHT